MLPWCKRFQIKPLLLWTTPLVVLGCGGDGGGTDIVLPSLIVSTTTTGTELDADGYQVLVDGTSGTPIGADSSLTVERLSEGQHTVTLSGLAGNCEAGDNPRTISITAGATTTAAFSVNCHATTGTITTSTSTTGAGSDPDGFTVTLDGSVRGTVGVNGSIVFSGVPPGPHLVGLTGLAANCQVLGDNPLSEVVDPGQSAEASFAIACTSTTPDAGAIVVTTRTGGAAPDPDGYAVSVDGAAAQAVATDGTLTVSNVAAGQHSVELTGLASNCSVSGNNPATVSVSKGATAQIGFTIGCPSPPTGTGSLQVTAATTGTSLDDSYTLRIDGGSPRALSANGSVTAVGLAVGTHSVQLSGVASNCTISGSDPQPALITADQTTTVAFTVTCVTPPPASGSIRVTASTSGNGLDPDGYQASVDGGTAQDLPINGARTFDGLTPGSHAVQLTGLATTCVAAGENPRSAVVAAAQTVTVAFTVTCSASQSAVNLQIANAYLTQSTQTLSGTIPLVQGRRAMLRVFVVANGGGSARPTVRARFFQGGTAIRTLSIQAPSESAPADVQQGSLTSSWNVMLEASLIQPGVSMLLDVDPTNSVAESNETDNIFPTSGTAQTLTVQAVPLERIRFVPISQGGAEAGNVTSGTKDQLVETTHQLYPLNQIQTDVRRSYDTPTKLEADGTGWNQVLSDIEMLRVTDPDGPGWTYYGVAKLDYQFGTVGLGFVGLPSAMGTDAPADIKRVLAHELGHTWNQLHTPCNNPPGQDPNYPYGTGIGVYGFDLDANSVKPPSTPDIMGYCSDPWISDYIYGRVMTYRASNSSPSQIVSPTKQPALLVWGRIVNGRPVLEPAFQMVTRTVLPSKSGPYTVQGIAGDGSALFSVSFDADEIADDPQDSRHFAFAVPLDSVTAARLSDIRLNGPGGVASAASLSLARLNPGAAAPDTVSARREADGVALRWNPANRPMIMVRDPDTGEVLSFARGGAARVKTSKGRLDLVESDGVHSRTRRISVTR